MRVAGAGDDQSRARGGDGVAQVHQESVARERGVDCAATRERGSSGRDNETGEGRGGTHLHHNRSVVDQVAAEVGAVAVVEREGRPGSDRGTVEGSIDSVDLSTAGAGEVATDDP